MKRRERNSLIVAVVIAAVLLGVVAAWLIAEPRGKPPQNNPPAQNANAAAETTVVVELAAASLEPEHPPSEQPAKEQKPTTPAESAPNEPAEPPGKPAGAGPLPLASNVQSKGQGNTPDAADQPESAEKPTHNAETATLPAERPPMPMTDSGQPMPAAAEHAPRELSRPRASKGKLPMIRNSGNTELLYRNCPRLEVAWVRERVPSSPEDRPPVVCEVVLHGDQLLHNNHSNGVAHPHFEYAIEKYVTEERVRAVAPQSLKLWQHRAQILQLSKVSTDEEARLEFGYYRHRTENYYLSKVATAFMQAEAKGAFTFDPTRNDYIEVVWGTNSDGKPCVESARFCTTTGQSITIEVD